MAYFGGGAQPVIDWEARDELYQLRDAITKLTAQVAELAAALKARDEAGDTALEVAGRWR